MIERKGIAYKSGRNKRQSQRERVFNLVKLNTDLLEGIDTERLAYLTRSKIHSLSARLAELEQEGKIYQNAKHSKDGVTYTVWKSTPAELVEARRAENWNKRFSIWLNKGMKNGFLSKKELAHIRTQAELF